VKRGTVLIDRTINQEGRENNTMAHECVHWHIHRFYFENLQKTTVDFDIAFRCPVRGITDSDDLTRVEERMEKQARSIAPRILMPKEATKIKLQEFFAAHDYSKDDPNRIKVLMAIVDDMAAFFHVPKVSAKYRMVDLGFMSHEDSLEIYNDDNIGSFEWDFAERPLIVKTSDHPLTRHITLEHAFYEFSRNAEFREILQSGHFRHVEDTFVINDQKYISKDENGVFKLTKYAIEHPQECTLIFEYTVNTGYGKAINLNAVGLMDRVETAYKKLPRYTAYVQNNAVFDAAKALDVVKADFDIFAKERTNLAPVSDFWERGEQIMAAKDIKTNAFKDRSGLDDPTISRIKHKKIAVTMRAGIAVCFGLDLGIKEASELLALAKLALNNDQECLAYEYVIINFKDCPLFEKNEVLKRFGVEPIGVRAS
jgi:Zn-dependent peptidase ImmA (M78 family)